MMQNIKSAKAVKGDVGKPLTAFFYQDEKDF